MTKDLAGHVAVVTGGARGLGYSIAAALAKRGADVGLLDLLPTVGESAERLSAECNVHSAGQVVDVTDAEAVEAAFAALEAELGQPTLLVTAAGITIWGASETVDPAVWQKVIDVNLSGTFFAAQAFGRRCLDTDRNGSVIFVSSMSGFIINQPQFQASYSASKAAVAHLAKSLGVEWATRGIRVNAIAPGYFLSDMTREFTDSNPELAEQWTASIPMGRMGEPGDLDGLVGFLASSDSAYITGQTITIDGGYTSL